MSMTLSGNGTITGLVSGGLPDGTILPADLSTGGPNWDTSGNLQFNSGYGSAATAYGCRAWVNFNGTGTVAIRASGNVSSITDNSTGNYTVNFTTAMPDANYSAVTSCTPTNSAAERTKIGAVATSSVQIVNATCDALNTSYDTTLVTVAIFR